MNIQPVSSYNLNVKGSANVKNFRIPLGDIDYTDIKLLGLVPSTIVKTTMMKEYDNPNAESIYKKAQKVKNVDEKLTLLKQMGDYQLKNISLKVGLYDTTIANCLKRNGINIRNAHQMKYYFLQFDTNWNLLMKHTNYNTIYDYVLNNTSCHSSHKSISRRIRLVSDTQEKAYGCYWKKILIEEEK